MWLSGWLNGLRSGWIQASARPRVRRSVGAKELLEQRVVLAEDFGDAPDTGAGTGRGNYETRLSDNGPRHTVVGATLMMGAQLDSEADASPNAAADGDDRSNRDENGVLNPPIDFQLTWDTIPRITVGTNNSTGSTATLTGWIDFNADGVFDNATERAQVAVPNLATSAQLVFPMVPRQYTGTTYARLRLSTDPAASNPTGLAFDGEVEDYVATIAQRSAGTVLSSIRTDTPAIANGDFFGRSIASLGDLDGDGISDLAVGAVYDDIGGANTGSVRILFMNADQTVRSEARIGSGTTGFPVLGAGVGFGRSLASMGDLNGDGIPDLAVGASKDSTGANGAGAVYLLRLNRDGSVQGSSKIDKTALPGIAALDYFGTSVANLGDVDGDGVRDLAVGAPGSDYAGTDRGGAYLLLLNANGSIKQSVVIGSGLFGGPNLADGDRFGFSLASLGRLTPVDDSYQTALAIGAVGDDTGGNRRGAVHIVFVKSNGFLLTDNGSGGSPNQKIAHQQAGGPALVDIDQFGQSLASIGYINGDAALVVGADGDSTQGTYRGAAYVLLLNPNGTVRTTNGITKIASGVGGGPTLSDRDYFGAAIANLGDIDGDGKTDIAIGATNDDTGGTDRGAVHILRLNPVPNVTNASPPSVKPNGATRIASGFNVADSSSFGTATVSLGDLDGDGVEDLAVGASLATISGGGANTGAVRILFMARDGAVKSTTEIGGTLGLASFDRFGSSIANIGDQDGDGVVDLAVGAHADNTGGADRGAVYLLRLNSNGTLKGFNKLANGVSGMPTLANSDYFGRSVASLGDIDGDGRTELAVGATFDSGNGTSRGAVYVLDFSPLGGPFGVSVFSATRIASGVNGGPVLPDSALFGSSLANIGDIDGDGITDLAVGATGEDGFAGALYVLFMNRNGTARASTRIADLVGGGPDLAAADNFGTSVAALGDIDGDGVRDVAVGADFDDTNGTNRGAVHVLRLATNGTVRSSVKLASGTGGLTTLRDSGRFGSSIALFGDQNRDGVRDLVVGARSDGTFGTLRGTAYILRLNVAPNLVPTGVNLTGGSIAEKATVGTAVGTFSTIDPNPGDTFTYTLVAGSGSTDNASFTIFGNEVRSNAVFDFETKNSFAIRVRTTDQGGLSFEQTFTVTVTNVNDNPTNLNISANTIAENSLIGTPIGTFSTVDQDVGDTFTYTLVPGLGSTDNALFTIVGNTLQSAAVFNFEVKSSYSIRVATLDSGVPTLGGSRSLIITVTNVNEAPTLDNSGNVFTVLGAGARQSAEMKQGTLVSDLLARGAGGNPISDPDAGALKGIALTAVDQSLGNFQYTLVTNNPAETDWINVDAAGAVSDASALLLPTTARIRFSTGRIPHHASAPPFLALESKLDAGLTFRAWDQTSGVAGGRGNAGTNGGSTAFSTATETSKVYFEARLFRHFNSNAGLNVYTLEAEFNALAAANNPAFEDRSTDAWTGFTVLLSNVPELATTPMYRMYYGVQFNANGTQIDMGYRYLTTNLIEAQALENSGPADKRPQRAGAYFREEGVNSGTGILGYIYTTQQPGTQQMRQIYRTDIVQKPTRPAGTSEGGTPTSFTPQENGDHVYTTNTAFETTKTGTWRVEDPRGFVRPLGGAGVLAPATSAGATATPIARAATVLDVGPAIDLFNASVTSTTFSAILPTSLATTSAAINPDHVSTTVDVGLIAPTVPAVPPQASTGAPADDEPTDLIPHQPLETDKETAATDILFASLGTTANDLCPW